MSICESLSVYQCSQCVFVCKYVAVINISVSVQSLLFCSHWAHTKSPCQRKMLSCNYWRLLTCTHTLMTTISASFFTELYACWLTNSLSPPHSPQSRCFSVGKHFSLPLPCLPFCLCVFLSKRHVHSAAVKLMHSPKKQTVMYRVTRKSIKATFFE